MVQFRFCLLVAALCACCSLGTSEVVTTPKAIIIPVPLIADPSKPASATDAPANPTAEPVTTIPETTKAPPLTTHAPITISTTPAPTTPDPTTNTPIPTTPAPSPPSPPTPIPPPAPTPIGPPEQGKWHYPNKTDAINNVTCIVLEFAAQLDIKYNRINESTLANLTHNVPPNATVIDGSCDLTNQFITIGWPAPGPSNITNTMTLSYYKNDTTKMYWLKTLNITLSPDIFTNSSSNATVNLTLGSEWQTPVATSYRCVPPTRLGMGDAASSAGYITFSKLQEQAFRNTNDTGFSSPRDCGGGDVPDAVPIAVGCALGGLVLVVLIAYLVGRRRSAARGYLSM